jgi:hypothetical protein
VSSKITTCAHSSCVGEDSTALPVADLHSIAAVRHSGHRRLQFSPAILTIHGLGWKEQSLSVPLLYFQARTRSPTFAGLTMNPLMLYPSGRGQSKTATGLRHFEEATRSFSPHERYQHSNQGRMARLLTRQNTLSPLNNSGRRAIRSLLTTKQLTAP